MFRMRWRDGDAVNVRIQGIQVIARVTSSPEGKYLRARVRAERELS